MQTVGFRHLADSTRADHDLLQPYLAEEASHAADHVLRMFEGVKGDCGVFLIDMHEHGLQTATHALNDGVDEETVVCALLHDIGHYVAPRNHGPFVAEMLRPFISDENYWVLQHHTVFQAYYYLHHIGGDRNERDRYKDHPHYDAAIRFVERWDQKAFDPDFKPEPIESFVPMVRRVFARTPDVRQPSAPLAAAMGRTAG